MRPNNFNSSSLETPEDIFINVGYQVSCAAHGIPVAHWHDLENFGSEKIRGFLKKITYAEAQGADGQYDTGVEVFTGGRSMKAIGDCVNGVCVLRKLSEQDLVNKFNQNCIDTLPEAKREEMVVKTQNLDKLENAAVLMPLTTP